MHHTCISWNDGQSPRKIHLAPLTAFGIWEVVDKNNIERFSGRCGRSPYSDMVLRSRDWDHDLNWDLIPQKSGSARLLLATLWHLREHCWKRPNTQRRFAAHNFGCAALSSLRFRPRQWNAADPPRCHRGSTIFAFEFSLLISNSKGFVSLNAEVPVVQCNDLESCENRVRIIAMQVVLVNRFLQEKRTASLMLCCLDSCRQVIPDLGLSLFTQIFVRASSGITLGCQYLSSCTLAQNCTRSFRTLLSKIHCFAARWFIFPWIVAWSIDCPCISSSMTWCKASVRPWLCHLLVGLTSPAATLNGFIMQIFSVSRSVSLSVPLR